MHTTSLAHTAVQPMLPGTASILTARGRANRVLRVELQIRGGFAVMLLVWPSPDGTERMAGK